MQLKGKRDEGVRESKGERREKGSLRTGSESYFGKGWVREKFCQWLPRPSRQHIIKICIYILYFAVKKQLEKKCIARVHMTRKFTPEI